MVEVRDNTLIWADNLAAKTGSSRRFGVGSVGTMTSSFEGGKIKSMREELDTLRSSLVRLCADESWLRKFWDECLERLKVEAACDVVGEMTGVGNGVGGSGLGFKE